MEINIHTCSISRNAGGLLDAVRDLYKNTSFLPQEISIYSYYDKFTEQDLSSWYPLNVHLFTSNNFFLYSAEIKKALLQSRSDILHVHGIWRYPHAFINEWKDKIKKPVIVSPHGMLDPYIIQNQSFFKRFMGNLLFAKKAFDNTDCFHALCEAELEVMRNYGIKMPIAVIPNGINIPQVDKKYDKRTEKKHLLFLGRLHPKKGVDLLLEALGRIKTEYPNILEGWIIDIVGWAQENFDQKLKTIVEHYHLSDVVIFHGGLFGEEKERMYATCDGYILPSHGEGLPMTVLEAWAWGKPVLMTPQCNIPEGFEKKAAIKIQNNSHSIFENLLVYFNNSEEERRVMGKNGKDLVINEFTWSISATKMRKLYQWVLGDESKPDFVHLY